MLSDNLSRLTYVQVFVYSFIWVFQTNGIALKKLSAEVILCCVNLSTTLIYESAIAKVVE